MGIGEVAVGEAAGGVDVALVVAVGLGIGVADAVTVGMGVAVPQADSRAAKIIVKIAFSFRFIPTSVRN